MNGMSSKKRDDPWAGRNGYTTLNKDSKVVWEPGLPAMVTARRQHHSRRPNPADDDDVSTDLKDTLKLSADAKNDWLPKAVKAIQKGNAKAKDVFDIVTHDRFISGIGNRIGQSLLRCITENILVFSEKQRESFAKSKLFREFAVESQLRKQKANSSDDEANSRGRSSSSSAGTGRRRRSGSREKAPPNSSAPPPSSGDGHAREERRSEKSRKKDASAEERALREQALREAQEKIEEDRRKAEAERQLAKDREMARRAKLGSAFLVDDEEEEDAPQEHIDAAKKAQDKRTEERSNALMDYDRRGSGSSTNEPEAQRFVESMGGGSILEQAHKMLLQKAGGDMRSPSVVRRDRNREEKGRSRSRRRRRDRSKSKSKSRSRPRQERPMKSTFRSPTPDGRFRGQARAARKAKMIASMLGQPVPRR